MKRTTVRSMYPSRCATWYTSSYEPTSSGSSRARDSLAQASVKVGTGQVTGIVATAPSLPHAMTSLGIGAPPHSVVDVPVALSSIVAPGTLMPPKDPSLWYGQ